MMKTEPHKGNTCRNINLELTFGKNWKKCDVISKKGNVNIRTDVETHKNVVVFK